jgi:transcriptional regulator with XRE-family HTH domain
MRTTALERDAKRAARKTRGRLVEDLERLCADSGVSHAALARASGVPGSFIARILAGTANPSLETYARLATALGADLSARIYSNTGPAIRDRHSVPILEAFLDLLHPRWHPFTEVAVHRPDRGWIDVVVHEEHERLVVAGEIQSTLNRIEQLIRWSGLKAESLPSWERWSHLPGPPTISRLLVVRWTRETRNAARAAERQLRVAYPVHPDDALAALSGTVAWPGAALIWARAEHGEVRLVSGR